MSDLEAKVVELEQQVLSRTQDMASARAALDEASAEASKLEKRAVSKHNPLAWVAALCR